MKGISCVVLVTVMAGMSLLLLSPVDVIEAAHRSVGEGDEFYFDDFDDASNLEVLDATSVWGSAVHSLSFYDSLKGDMSAWTAHGNVSTSSSGTELSITSGQSDIVHTENKDNVSFSIKTYMRVTLAASTGSVQPGLRINYIDNNGNSQYLDWYYDINSSQTTRWSGSAVTAGSNTSWNSRLSLFAIHIYTTGNTWQLCHEDLTDNVYGKKCSPVAATNGIRGLASVQPFVRGDTTLKAVFSDMLIELGLDASATSKPIDLTSYGYGALDTFEVSSVVPDPMGTSITFDILDASDDSLIVDSVMPGSDLSYITAEQIKLRVNIHRDAYAYEAPYLEWWRLKGFTATTVSTQILCDKWDPHDGSVCASNARVYIEASGHGSLPITISGNVNGGDHFNCSSGVTTCTVALPEGEGTVNVTADNGLDSDTESRSYKYYTNPPELYVTQNPSAPNAYGFYTDPVSYYVEGYDPAGYGVESVQIQVDNGGWYLGQTYEFTTDGDHTFDAMVRNEVGRTIEANYSISIDMTPPVGKVNMLSGSKGLNNWWVTDNLEINASATDNFSGVSTVEFQIDGSGEWVDGLADTDTVRGDGIHAVKTRATDNAGNMDIRETEVKIDTVDPVVNVLTTGTSGDNGWYVSMATLKPIISDAHSGVGSKQVSVNYAEYKTLSGDTLVINDGTKHVSFRGVDKAGNYKDYDLDVKVDTLPPAMTLDITPVDGTNGWHTGNVKVSATATDAVSGVDVIEARVDSGWWNDVPLIVSAEGIHTVEVRAIDKAGNETRSNTMTIKIDKTWPTVGVSFVEGTALGEILAKSTVADEVSGVASTECSLNSAAWEAVPAEGVTASTGDEVRYRIVDNAGNEYVSSPMIVNVVTGGGGDGSDNTNAPTPYPTPTAYPTPRPASTRSPSNVVLPGIINNGLNGIAKDTGVKDSQRVATVMVELTVMVFVDQDDNGYMTVGEETDDVVVQVYTENYKLLGEGSTKDGVTTIILRNFVLGETVQLELPYIQSSDRVKIDDAEMLVEMSLPVPDYPVFMP